jgi:hypothetical protein
MVPIPFNFRGSVPILINFNGVEIGAAQTTILEKNEKFGLKLGPSLPQPYKELKGGWDYTDYH